MKLYEFEIPPILNGKPTRNNLGALIHPTEEGIMNFWKWFGKSVTVDGKKRPIVFFHGTPSGTFESFHPASYFTHSSDIAQIYMNPSASSISSKAKTQDAPVIYPVYLKILNPFDTRKSAIRQKFMKEFYMKWGTGTDLQDGLPDWTDGIDLVEWIEETGQPYDALYLHEGGIPDGDKVISRGISIVPLKSNQVKSAIGNKGTFSSSDSIMESDYRIDHTAPMSDSGSPLYDVTLNGTYPADVYSSNGLTYYSSGEKFDSEVYNIMLSAKGNPLKSVTIYRAVPKDRSITDINVGDWVSLSKGYAVMHGKSALGGKYKILNKKVRAQDIFTNGDSWDEWGYDPQPVDQQLLATKKAQEKLKLYRTYLDRLKRGEKVIMINKYQDDPFYRNDEGSIAYVEKQIQEYEKKLGGL